MILWFWTPNYQNSLNRMHEPESSLRSLLACHSQNEQRPSYYVCFTLLYSLPSVSRLQLPFRFFYISLQTIPYRILLLCFLSRSLFLFLSMRRTEREKKKKSILSCWWFWENKKKIQCQIYDIITWTYVTGNK